MFYCERCGTSFNAGAAATAMACPRCRAKDGVYSPLTFSLFDSPPITKEGRDRKGAGAPRPGADGSSR
jgi:predicted  nucleic acid-binding Zn-ribbon protein